MNPAPMPYIVALYAGLFGLLLFGLGFRVTMLRRASRVGIGDGGDLQLARAIRVHANALEWGIPTLLLLLIAEENRASALLLHACGIAFIVARVIHAIGLGRSSGPSTGRVVGMAITLVVVVVLACWNISRFAVVASVI
jgi:uncharacterized protein